MPNSKARARAVRGGFALVPAALAISCSSADPPRAPAAPAEAHESLSGAAAKYDWTQFGGDPQHSSNNVREATITRANVGSLSRVFAVGLGGTADGAPIVLTDVPTASGARDLLYLTTKGGQVLARDAHSGALVWSAAHGPGGCKINNGGSPCYTTSSPAADPGRAFVYSYGLDGRAHKHAAADGSEVTTGGWPQLATTKPFDEKGSPPLAVATAKSGASYLYVANGGYPGDRGDYQGHLTAIDLASGAQTVFNTLCSGLSAHFTTTSPDCAQTQAAVWARAAAVYDPSLDLLFAASGNGTYDPTREDWGDSVFALRPDLAGTGAGPLDSYTPADFQQLQDQDADLGSTAPAILPVPGGTRHIAAQCGKDAKIRLIDLTNLSSQGGPGHTGGELFVMDLPQGSEVLTQPAVWTNPADSSVWVFVANDAGTSGMTLSTGGNGAASLVTRWKIGAGGSSPLVANGLVFTASSGTVRALDPTTGNVLWHNTQIGGIHWESPVVANGVLYITDDSGNLSAYAPTSSTKVAVKINFQPSGAPVPAGYLADTGAAFGNRGNGFSYGWNADNSGQTRWRKSSLSPDVRYDTLTHLQKPANPNAFWELALPAGSYAVRIVSGDPSFLDSVFKTAAEGTLVVSGTPTASAHWVDKSAVIRVTDGRLTLTNAPGAANNKIDFVEVTQQ